MLRMIKYPGSKTTIVGEIQRVYDLSQCSRFVDVFSGSASVLINIHAGMEIYNDINGKPGVTSSRKVSFYTNGGIKL